MGNTWSPPANCLQIVLRGGGKECEFGPLRIEEHTVANDQRLLSAGVSGEEARHYVRGVNDHVAKGSKRYRPPLLGCVAFVFLGAALFGIMMSVFHEEDRLRCKKDLCDVEGGEDPLVDDCCVFWCCGNTMRTGGATGRTGEAALPERPEETTTGVHRPYDRWDIWANETYFGDTERCSLYDGSEHLEEHDANHDCSTCPALDHPPGGCKTRFEGKASSEGVGWPLLFLIPFLLPVPFIVAITCAQAFATPRLYAEAFDDWRARGIVAHVQFVGGGKHSPNYLRLFFPPGQVVQMAPQGYAQPGTFMVQVPPGAPAGQLMQIQSPGGVTMQIQVPAGVAPGGRFAVANPAPPSMDVVVGQVQPAAYAAEPDGPILQAKAVPEGGW